MIFGGVMLGIILFEFLFFPDGFGRHIGRCVHAYQQKIAALRNLKEVRDGKDE